MNYLMKQYRMILFLLAVIMTLQIILVFRIEGLTRTTEVLEPVFILERVAEMEKSEPNAATNPIEEPEIQPRINCRLDDEIQQMILERCEKYNIDFAFAMAVIFKESSFKPSVVSKSNDYGLMQINKINHEWLSEKLGITDFLDPEQNVTAGLYMLRDLFEKYEDPAKVLMAYNLGETGAKRLWVQNIYSTDYAERILQQADIFNAEIAERMGENDHM